MESEEKLLRDNRRQLPSNEFNQNSNGISPEWQSSLITPQHLTQIPTKSILDHQQVGNDRLINKNRF